MRKQSIYKIQTKNWSQILKPNQLTKLKGGNTATAESEEEIIIVDDIGGREQ